MNKSPRPGERGVSVLGALIVVLTLGTGAVAVSELANPSLSSVSGSSQTAALTAAQLAAQQAALKKAEVNNAVKKKCTELQKQLKGKAIGSSVGGGETEINSEGATLEKDKCVSAFVEGTKAAPTLACRGLVSKVWMKDGKPTKMVSEASKDVKDPGVCRTFVCDESGNNCNVKFTDLPAGRNIETIPEVFKLLPPDAQKSALDKLDTGTISKADQDTLNSILNENREPIEKELNNIAKQQRDISDQILKLTKECEVSEIAGNACTSNELVKLRNREKDLADERNKLRQRLDDLDGKKKVLAAKKPCEGSCVGEPDPKTDPTGYCVQNPTLCRDNVPCAGGNCYSGRGDTFGGPGGLGQLLGGLGSLFGAQQSQPPAGPPCPSDPNAYAQYQQQYNQQLQQYNQQLQQYNYQAQIAARQGLPAPPRPTPPSQCTPSSGGGQQCPQAPTKPSASTCPAGTWQPRYSGANNACVSGWQCTPGGQSTAELSCQPEVADVGMTLAITWSCSAGVSTGSGFSTGGAQSGAATTTITAPPGNANTATYGLTCTEDGRTAQAQCSVQVAKPAIVLVANPKTVTSGGTSALGWVTSGMNTCVISSPDLAAFTSQNASSTSVNGTATTPALTVTNNATTSYNFLLHCTTVSGGTRDATTTVEAIP